MKEIIVSKEKLIEKIKENLETYKNIYLQLKEDYFIVSVEKIKEALTSLENGEEKDFYLNLNFPKNQEHNYKKVIGMLEMHVETQISLDEDEYQKYILNEWNWKSSFIAEAKSLAHYKNSRLSNSPGMGSAGPSGPLGFYTSNDAYINALDNF